MYQTKNKMKNTRSFETEKKRKRKKDEENKQRKKKRKEKKWMNKRTLDEQRVGQFDKEKKSKAIPKRNKIAKDKIKHKQAKKEEENNTKKTSKNIILIRARMWIKPGQTP